MTKKTIAAWVILVIICIVCILIFVLLLGVRHDEPEAQIYSCGELIRTVPLSDSCEFTVQTGDGYNTIRIENGSVCVIEADCPDKVCIRSGAVSKGTVPIICLPHRLEIRVVSSENDMDAVIS